MSSVKYVSLQGMQRKICDYIFFKFRKKHMPALFVNASYRHGLSCKNKNNNNKKNYKYQPSV